MDIESALSSFLAQSYAYLPCWGWVQFPTSPLSP
jgi:hypothetical protein